LGHHRGADYLSKIVQETNQLKPDFILITGDLVDTDVALSEDEFRPLNKLQAPVYYVGGNHENEIDTTKTLQLIHQNGVNILHNQRALLHKDLKIKISHIYSNLSGNLGVRSA